MNTFITMQNRFMNLKIITIIFQEAMCVCVCVCILIHGYIHTSNEILIKANMRLVLYNFSAGGFAFLNLFDLLVLLNFFL